MGSISREECIRLARKALGDEVFSSIIYSRLAKLYSEDSVRNKLSRIAEMEKNHVKFWVRFLKSRDVATPTTGVGRLKLTLYTTLFRILGLGLTLRILEMSEHEAIKLYSRLLEVEELSENEREELKKMLEDELIHEQEFASEESRFEDFLLHVRDAVLGMNDGLVEVLSVTAGLAGAYGDPYYVAIGGFIVGVGGAFSMGLGAYASVRAQKQVHEGILNRINIASRFVAHVFKERVINYMLRKGYSKDVSNAIAEESSRNRKLLTRVIAEEEYGIREETLENPFKAGVYTGSAYALGAFVPLIPYFLGLPISVAIILSLLFAALALALTGFIVAISANLGIKRKILEMILAGLGSAGATYAVGRLASTVFGIEVE